VASLSKLAIKKRELGPNSFMQKEERKNRKNGEKNYKKKV